MTLNVDDVGSTSMLLSWDDIHDSRYSYNINVLNNNKEVLSLETDDSSMELKNLEQDTNYVLKLSRFMKGVFPYVSNIRIQHKTRRWLSILEVRIFDENGRELTSRDVNLSSSSTYSRGVLSNSMDRRNYPSNTWSNGAMLRSSSNTYWQAKLKAPTRLKEIQIHTTSSHKLDSQSNLFITYGSGKIFKYNLGGTYNVNKQIQHQLIPMNTVPFGHPDGEKPKITSISNIRIEHKGRRWVGIVELMVYDANNRVLPSGKFHLSSSSTHPSGRLSKVMDRRGSYRSSWTFGAMLRASSNTYLNARLRTPVELKSIRIYTHSGYRFDSKSNLIVTATNGNVTTYNLGGRYKVSNLINHQFINLNV